MTKEFDEFWDQAKFHFTDKAPPLKTCGNCGKEIVSVWEHLGEELLLHKDKSICWRIKEDV